jgi:hypothetical protein
MLQALQRSVRYALAHRTVFAASLGGVALSLLAFACTGPGAIDEAEASQPAVAIKLLVNSKSNSCVDPGNFAAIKKLARQETRRINEQGGIAGRRVKIELLDEQRDADISVKNVRDALADPRTIALIGLSNADRAKAVFEQVGPDIKSSEVPFLSDLSVNSIFAAYPNVFTTRASQDDERIPVLVQFSKQIGSVRPAFLGTKGNVFSETLEQGLKTAPGALPLVVDHQLIQKDGKLDPVEVGAVIEELRKQNPDLLFLTIGGNRTGDIIKELLAAKVTPPLFLSGRIDALDQKLVKSYPSPLYQVTWDELPEVYSDRLRKVISISKPEEWVFGGGKNPDAPGWATGECKDVPQGDDLDPLSARNLRAVSMGGQYADMIGLVAAAARSAGSTAGVPQIRSYVTQQLKTTYAFGRGTYKGTFDNWSFRPATRAAARTPFVVQYVPALGRTQLAPAQFVRLRNDVLRTMSTLYLDLDLVRAFSIDDNNKSFYAEFYVSIHDEGKGASIDQIEFSNAYLDPKTNDRELTIRILNSGGKSDAFPDDVKIYQVAGRFAFEPRLANYPFDTQKFTIDIRPRRGDTPFIVQPPPPSLRDKAVEADGWIPQEQYVAYDEDFIPATDARTHSSSVAPFYRATFAYVMTRETTDYFLRVVVPLAFIIAVAYLSIFIPRAHFEAIVTIQVTALLSSVALYLALPKVDADTTTLSDRIFLFTYFVVSLMIGISILRINPFIASRDWVRHGLGIVHIFLVPVMMLAMAIYVYQSSVLSV